MATTYYNTREVELAVQEESAFGTSPGSPIAGDFFKHTSRLHITPQLAKYYRDQDGSVGQGSILGVQDGRSSAQVRIECDAIPSGAASPTAPDISLLLKNHFGSLHTGSAHTTTTSGSSGTSLVLTAGGGAASGVAVGDLIAVDVDATYGYEVRRVTAVATDTVTMNAALSTDPATGRDVKLGTTYIFSASSAASLYLWQFIGAVKHACPGLILPEYEVSIDFNSDTPVVKQSFSGMSKAEVTHSESRPTPTTTGDPLIPTKGYGFIGSDRYCMVSASVRSNNGRTLRQNESCSLEPTGVKFTENNGYTMIEEELHLLLSTGDVDTAALYNSAKSSVTSPLDVVVQLGVTPGDIMAWSTPKFLPTPERVEMDGEMGVKLAGRAIGTSGDDDLFVAFI